MANSEHHIDNVFFLGIGGIGMSALARYFLQLGKNVAGYDKTSSPLTEKLITEGAKITHEDAIDFFNVFDFKANDTIVIYTPAIPQNLKIRHYFVEEGYQMFKRSEVLGKIVDQSRGIAVAGTHGKTTTSTMIAHLLRSTSKGCNAFLGGISVNYNTNVWYEEAEYTVVEADEYDRSFLTLFPEIAVVTSAEPDHMDIYADEDDFNATFEKFISQVDKDGACILNYATRHLQVKHKNVTYYSLDHKDADVYADKIKIKEGRFVFDLVTPKEKFEAVELVYPGFHNLENYIACICVAIEVGVPEMEWRQAGAYFMGVKRRFEKIYEDDSKVFIDDYAHHPGELASLIKSLRAFYPGKKLTMVFQPHLYSRTRDFMEGFAKALSQVDELILLDIYPARELPIEGVTSDALLEMVDVENKVSIDKASLVKEIEGRNIECLVTAGAGDIDREVEKVKEAIETKIRKL